MQWLLHHVPMDKNMLRKWLKAGYVDHDVLHPTEEGAAQGGPLSPVLANLTLNGLERLLERTFPKDHHQGTEPQGECRTVCRRLHRDR